MLMLSATSSAHQSHTGLPSGTGSTDGTPAVTDDLTARITAALDHAEQVARATVERRWVEGSLWFRWMMVPTKDGHGSERVADEDARHMALWDPKNVLDLIAAHREIVRLHRVEVLEEQRLRGILWPEAYACVVCDVDLEVAYDPLCRGLSFGPAPACDTVLAIAKAHRVEVPGEG